MTDREYYSIVLALVKPMLKQMKNKSQNPRFSQAYHTLVLLNNESESRLKELDNGS